MRTVPAAVQAHLDDPTVQHQVATYASIGGVRLTDYWQDVTGPGGTYLAKPGYIRSAFTASLESYLVTVNLQTFVHPSGLSAATVQSGGYEGAAASFGFIAPGRGWVSLLRGNVGRIQMADYEIEVELRGMLDKLRATSSVNIGSAGCGDGFGGGSGSDLYVPGAEQVLNP